MPSCDSAAAACSAQTCSLGIAKPRTTFTSTPKSSLEKMIREVTSMACPRFEDRIGKKGCRLQVVVLRVSLLGQEPISWLASLGDWAISKQEALQVEVTSNHDASRVERIASTGAEVRNSHEGKRIWSWLSG